MRNFILLNFVFIFLNFVYFLVKENFFRNLGLGLEIELLLFIFRRNGGDVCIEMRLIFRFFV